MSTATAGTPRRWLFESKRVGEAMTGPHLRRRLGRLGIRALSARTGAVMRLAVALPPSILAELLRISETSASKGYRLAGGEWARYTATALTRYSP